MLGDMANLPAAAAAERLILLGKPSTKVLRNLLCVVVDHLLARLLVPKHRLTLFILLYLFGDFLDDLIPESISHVRAVPALIVSNVIGKSHEDFVVVHSSSGALHRNEFFLFASEYEQTCLHAY
jgi:hypothetical protein